MIRRALAAIALFAAAGCYADDPLPPPPKRLGSQGDLAVDIRESAHVDFTITGTEIDASVTLTNGFGLAPHPLSGQGRVEAFPEADTVLYTARFEAPASFDGPCGGEDVSLALALHRRGGDLRVGGSLTAYCGKSVWHGVPRKVLRLTGELPLPR